MEKTWQPGREEPMPRKLTKRKATPRARSPKSTQPQTAMLADLMWRINRLERQVRTLSELVRDHAEDADRLVTIVSEDHEALRRELLREHQERLRDRKRDRDAGADDASSKVGLTN
jgi:hypothetical protein